MKNVIMEHTIRLFRIIYRITLSALVLLIAVLPLIINMSLVNILVVLPTLLILIFSLTIIIEQKIDSLAKNKSLVDKKSRCLIIKCLHKNCLG